MLQTTSTVYNLYKVGVCVYVCACVRVYALYVFVCMLLVEMQLQYPVTKDLYVHKGLLNRLHNTP